MPSLDVRPELVGVSRVQRAMAVIAIQSEVGIGDTLHDLREAILDDSYVLPDTSADLLDPEIADGVNYHGNDSANAYSGVEFGW